MARPRQDINERFWSKVSIKDKYSCWEWTSGLDRYGYGEFWSNDRQTSIQSHRVSWTLINGDIPDKLFVLHKCDNRKCVNPDHLFLGTQLDNMKDMESKGRRANGKSKLSEMNILEIRELSSLGVTGKVLSKEYGVLPSCISKIIKKQTWSYL